MHTQKRRLVIIFADIHGNEATFQKLLSDIPEEEKKEGIAIAGDLIDRGSRSMQMVQWCIDNPDVGVVSGNHEIMMIEKGMVNAEYMIEHGREFPGDDVEYRYGYGSVTMNMWGANGGYDCLQSYCKDPEDLKTLDLDLFEKHIEWMKNLPLYLEYEDVKNNDGRHLLVTHSSADTVWKWSDKRRKEQHSIFVDHLVWGRPDIIRPINNIYNIFGHTPQPNGPRVKSHYANIDTGCFHSSKIFGRLTAISFPSMKIYSQENIDGYYKSF